MILLDTSVLSAVLRRRQSGAREKALAERLQGLLNSGERVGLPGIVLQELLSGVRDSAQFEQLKGVLLRGYRLVIASPGDHLMAAEIVNKCRRKGIAVSSVDALIAALALNARARLFAIDEDFDRISGVVPLRLLPE